MASIAGKNDATTQNDKFAPASKFMELVEYDAKTQTLDITFKRGGKRRYMSVSPATYATFKQSPTQDSYYSRGIKGRAASVPIVTDNIGTNASKPLDKKYQRRTLDAGIRKEDRKRPADFIRR